jgi:aryl-alcohol dehydrogenase-like predicted oxidoreductase
MEYRQLGTSGLMVPVLCFGTATFGGSDAPTAWGNIQVAEATRIVDLLLEADVNFIDTADVYSGGRSEEILGQAIAGRRDKILLATKACFRTEPGPNGFGTSRLHLIRACEASLKRLRTDYIDLYQMHGFDAVTPVEETLRALDDLVRAGKVRYVGCSNFSGWHLMKALAASEKYGLPRYVAHQAYYSLAGRDYEWELMPLAVDQKVSTIVWSPLAGGRLSGKIRRNQPAPAGSRAAVASETAQSGTDEALFKAVDVLDALVDETGKTHSQIALNWLLQRPSVTSVIFGARNEAQLKDNLGAAGWALTSEQIKRLDTASELPKPYPYWHQRYMAERNPPPV